VSARSSGAAGRLPPTGVVHAAGVLVVLATVAAATFSPRVMGGGRIADDWALAAAFRFDRDLAEFAPTRLLFETYWSLVHPLLGVGDSAQIAKSVAGGIVLCASLYWVLTTARLPRTDALIISTLVLIFEPTSSVRIWPSASFGQVAVAMYLLGLGLAWRAYGTRGRQAAVLHASSVGLYLASVLLYPTAATAILFSVALYRLVAPWPVVMKRWPADAGVVVVAALTQLGAEEYARSHGLDLVVHAGKLLAGTILLGTWAVFPLGSVHAVTVERLLGGCAIAMVLVGVARGWRSGRHSDDARELRSWSLVGGIGLAFAVVSYLCYIPAAGYTPVAQGIGNRSNVLAAAGIVTFAWSCARLVVLLAARAAHRRGLVLTLAPLLLASVLGAGYASATVAEEREWQRAGDEQRQVLARIRKGGRPPSGSRLFVFGSPAFVATGVPVFFAPYDLEPAVQLLWSDDTLHAVPVAGYTRVRCGGAAAVPSGLDPFDRSQSGAYGPRLLFLDVRDGRVASIGSRAECARWTRSRKPVASPGL
jgi:hypothetical protein